jgi:hypothetical protein
MDRRRFHIGFALLGCILGCGRSVPPPIVPDLPDPLAAQRAIELFDTNHDGLLDSKELEKCPGLKAAIKRVDSNGDGKISEQEIAGRIKSWADSGTGRALVNCRVLHKGKPLEGAKVVFVPEPFLGGALQNGSGTASKAGYASISRPYEADIKVRGLSPGFYRVEITKDGEAIPAKYNTQTTLGAEVSGEDPRGGLDFDVQY